MIWGGIVKFKYWDIKVSSKCLPEENKIPFQFDSQLLYFVIRTTKFR